MQKIYYVKLTGVILLFFYGVSTFVGIGVFHCGCTDSQRVVVLTAQNGCFCSNLNDECCPHSEQHQRHHHEEESGCEHDHECCTFVYQYVDIDQMIVKQGNDRSTKTFSYYSFSFLSINGWINDIKKCGIAVKNNSPPPFLRKIPIIYLFAQLRL